MNDQKSLKIVVSGQVQGVNFRSFIYQQALKLGLKGYVRNLPSGFQVEIQVEGIEKSLNQLIEVAKIGPPAAEVTDLKLFWSAYQARYEKFQIRY
ncbi:MAG TPA: acylphosphatase [Dehalococcoidales bacterium]|nr:acylphosphatase [Dehalococcoidales bacterium]